MDRLESEAVALSAHHRINQTTRPYPARTSIKELFERCARRFPDADAVIHRERILSYRELNDLANALAARLRREGVRPGAVVGVVSDRSPELIVALTAILKCGAAYLPFDQFWPDQRLRDLFGQSECQVLVADQPDRASALANRFPSHRVISAADATSEGAKTEGASDPPLRVDPDAIAYINFTSGSTGRPKGVPIRHRGVIRLVFGARYANLDSRSRLLLLAPVTFDAATFEIWGALLHGGTCVLYPSPRLRFSELRQVLQRRQVTVLFLTTALFNAIVDEAPQTLDSVGKILTGGETHSLTRISQALCRYGPDRLTNVYGPTECTTFATYYPIRALSAGETALPIGRPIQNTRVYVVNDNRLCSPGEIGELLLAGPGLSPGYLNLPEVTRKHFVEYEIGGVSETLYRTGDRVFLNDDGNLVFLGRLDDQVKISGYRIELGEISHHLDQHQDIRQHFVTVIETLDGGKSLIAFIVPANDRCAPAAIAEYLRARLPGYMVPSEIQLCDSFPLSSTGKVNRRALLSSYSSPGADHHALPEGLG